MAYPQLYKVIAWHKLGRRLKSPPLKVGDRMVQSTEEKAEVLREEILGRFSSAADLDYDPLEGCQESEAKLYWETSATMEEVEQYTIGVSSTSPGVDGITIRLLKACWEHIKNAVHGVFEKCFQLCRTCLTARTKLFEFGYML